MDVDDFDELQLDNSQQSSVENKFESALMHLDTASSIYKLERSDYIQAEKYVDKPKEHSELMYQEKMKQSLYIANTQILSINAVALHQLQDIATRLSSEQKMVFDIFTYHLMNQSTNIYRNDLSDHQLRMFISGEAGTGKSFVIKAVEMFCRIYYPYDDSLYGPSRCNS